MGKPISERNAEELLDLVRSKELAEAEALDGIFMQLHLGGYPFAGDVLDDVIREVVKEREVAGAYLRDHDRSVLGRRGAFPFFRFAYPAKFLNV